MIERNQMQDSFSFTHEFKKTVLAAGCTSREDNLNLKGLETRRTKYGTGIRASRHTMNTLAAALHCQQSCSSCKCPDGTWPHLVVLKRSTYIIGIDTNIIKKFQALDV